LQLSALDLFWFGTGRIDTRVAIAAPATTAIKTAIDFDLPPQPEMPKGRRARDGKRAKN
jgi:hypothetical protein